MKKSSLSYFFATCLFSFLFYLPGVARAPLPGDSAAYVGRAIQFYVNSYAQTHPLHIFLARAWMAITPFWHPVYSMGVLSALFGSLTIAVIFLLSYRFCGNIWGGLAGAACLMVSHTMWYHAMFPEVYTINTFFQALVLLACFEWYQTRHAGWLTACFFFGALGCANHLLVGMTLIPVSLWVAWISVKKKRLVRSLACMAAGGAVGILPLAILFWRDAGALGFKTAFRLALVGGGGIRGQAQLSYGGAMFNLFDPWLIKQLIVSVGFGFLNFIGLAWILIAIGFVLSWRRRQAFTVLLVCVFALHFLFGASYKIYEHWAFLLPCWVLLPIFAGVGFPVFMSTLVPQGRKIPHGVRNSLLLVLLVATPVFSYALFAISCQTAVDAKPPPQHDTGRLSLLSSGEKFRFLFWPPKASATVEADKMKTIIEDLPENSHLFLRSNYLAIAYCLQTVENLRPDVVLNGNSKDLMLKSLQAKKRVFVRMKNEAKKISTLGYTIHFEAYNDNLFEVILAP
jgi:hypothetical protein